MYTGENCVRYKLLNCSELSSFYSQAYHHSGRILLEDKLYLANSKTLSIVLLNVVLFENKDFKDVIKLK